MELIHNICIVINIQIYGKMNLNVKLFSEKQLTPYQKLAEKYSVHANYVGEIARGERKAIRGKALLIKNELIAMIEEKELQSQ
jgi:hypothetical protein